ncbi:MAG: O-antigen ligase family protein, partial [Planctomycetes bacterium]|nr:O-antigen ligase family protein [Planctomycetota bacterium]
MSESCKQNDLRVESGPQRQLYQGHPVHPADRASVRVMDGLIEAIAIFLVVFSPIAFGATERWSKLVVVTAACSMCAAWCFRAVLKHKLSFAKGPLNVLVAVFILLACIQLMPLPGFLASRLSPAAIHSQTGALPRAAEPSLAASLPAEAGHPSQDASAQCISVNRAAGRSSLYLVVSYAIAFLIILNTCRRRSQISRLLGAVIVVGFAVSILGILGCVTPNGKLLWFREAPAGAIPFGPFVNRNHFAGYLVMVMPITLGMLVGIRNRDKRTLLGFAAAVMAAAVLLSASRGGVISLAAGAVIFGLMLISTRAYRKNLFPIVLVACIAVVGAASVGIGPLIARGADLAVGDFSSEFRWPVWKDTAQMIAAFPVLGVGMGCFRYIFPAYKTFPVQLLFTHAENEYL